MSEHAGASSTEGPSDSLLGFPTLPSPALQDRKREALRERTRRRAVLALLLGAGLTALGMWVSRGADREILNLPRVTVEVHGMS